MNVSINGSIVEKSQNTMVSSEGYNFGYGVFETIKVQDEKLVLFNKHMERLESSLALIELEVGMDRDEIEQGSYELLRQNRVRDGALKVLVSKSGEGSDLVISTRETNYTEDMYKNGFKLSLSRMRRNPDSIIPYIKSLNYMENIIERREAMRRGYDDCLFLNTRGYLAETSISNIFAVKDEVLITPRLSSGILDGVVRSAIIRIAKSLNFEVVEGDYTLRDMASAEEVFLTNSLMGVMPVGSIEDRYYNLNRNSTTRLFRTEYEKMISVV